jgi:hypothetical protein
MWEMFTQFWTSDHVRHIQDGTEECSCSPEPERPTYSTKERTPRLLSEVLATIEEGVEQIDNLPKEWLEFLVQPEYDTENEKDFADIIKGNESVNTNECQKVRKPTDLEMKGRRKELADYIKELKWRIKKSAMEDNQEAKLKSQTVAEIDAPGEKNIA